MRATPPWARMSAGTRSSAMTATAPASSAIFACSASTTSMITPPFSISASPLLTRIVPIWCMAFMLVERRLRDAGEMPAAGGPAEPSSTADGSAASAGSSSRGRTFGSARDAVGSTTVDCSCPPRSRRPRRGRPRRPGTARRPRGESSAPARTARYPCLGARAGTSRRQGRALRARRRSRHQGRPREARSGRRGGRGACSRGCCPGRGSRSRYRTAGRRRAAARAGASRRDGGSNRPRRGARREGRPGDAGDPGHGRPATSPTPADGRCATAPACAGTGARRASAGRPDPHLRRPADVRRVRRVADRVPDRGAARRNALLRHPEDGAAARPRGDPARRRADAARKLAAGQPTHRAAAGEPRLGAERGDEPAGALLRRRRARRAQAARDRVPGARRVGVLAATVGY